MRNFIFLKKTHIMKKLFIVFVLGVFFSKGYAQSGINKKSLYTSVVLDVESSNQGVLIPRVSIQNLLNSAPIIHAPKDGLLVYNTNSATKKSLFHWDAQANTSNGAWSRHLFFKETPKTAVIGLTGNNFSTLNNFGAGEGAWMGGANTFFSIISSGNMPVLEVLKTPTNANIINIGSGIYTLEVSLLISAPAPDAGRGEPLQGNYYNMGYYMDFYVEHPTNSNIYSYARVERSVVSPLNDTHRVTFITTIDVSNISETNIFSIWSVIGRRSGSTHRDLVNIIPNGSYYKLTKLN